MTASQWRLFNAPRPNRPRRVSRGLPGTYRAGGGAVSAGFTPKPWVASQLRTHAANPDNNGVDIGGKDCSNIGLVYLHEGGRGETIANARLIAAAPEMYEALRAVLKLHEAHHNHLMHVSIRALLARIDGETS